MLIGGELRSPAPQLVERLVPPAPLLWAALGRLATTPEANIIKLPNVSASMPQLKAAVTELQGQGFAIPDYPDDPQDDEQREVRARYGLTEGQAVAFVVKHGELTLVPLRQTLFDLKGSVQPGETSDPAAIREQVAAAEAARVARGE